MWNIFLNIFPVVETGLLCRRYYQQRFPCLQDHDWAGGIRQTWVHQRNRHDSHGDRSGMVTQFAFFLTFQNWRLVSLNSDSKVGVLGSSIRTGSRKADKVWFIDHTTLESSRVPVRSCKWQLSWPGCARFKCRKTTIKSFSQKIFTRVLYNFFYDVGTQETPDITRYKIN